MNEEVKAYTAMGITVSDEVTRLKAENARLQAEKDALVEKYNELIYAVETKFPNETRHQTALRYIQQREHMQENGPAKSTLGNTTL